MGTTPGADSNSETAPPPPFLVDADGNELETTESGKSYKYRDFSNVTEDDEDALGSEAVAAPAPSRNSMETSIRVQKFPVKLYAILAQKEFNEIITWMPHGRSWKVLKPNIFESMVMPLFFEYSNYHSFNRLVNAWSFRRVSSGPDRGSYYHELFLRGKPHLQKYMRRLPKTHKKLPMKKQDEPDFYRLDQTNPLPALDDAPIPGAIVASTAAMGGALDSKLSDPIADPSMAAAAARPMTIRIPGAQGAAGQTRSMYPGLDSGLLGGGAGSALDDYGDMFAQQQQAHDILPNQALSASQDQYGSAQMSRGMGAAAFRSSMAPQRFRAGAAAGMSMLDANGIGMAGMGMESDLASLQQQQHMNSLRSHQQAQMASMNHMNKMTNPMAAAAHHRMGQMNAMHGMSTPMQQMQAQQHMMAARGGAGMLGDMPSQHHLMGAYSRDFGADSSATAAGMMSTMSGAMGASALDDYGGMGGLMGMPPPHGGQ